MLDFDEERLNPELGGDEFNRAEALATSIAEMPANPEISGGFALTGEDTTIPIATVRAFDIPGQGPPPELLPGAMGASKG